MKIPTHIKIKKNVSYEIVFVPSFANGKTMAETRPWSKQIVVALNQPPSEMISTILHEVLHACEIENKIVIRHRQIYALEKALYSVLKLNKWI